MCWSKNISLATVIIESLCLIYVAQRSLRATNPLLKSYRLHFPVMLTIISMEAVEALLWSRPDELLSIESAATATATAAEIEISHNSDVVTVSATTSCPLRNHALTTFVWLFILPFQPYLILMQERRSSTTKHQRDLLRGPELLALTLGIVFDSFVAYSALVSGPFRSLSDSGLRGYMSGQTCTYVGLHGHLHWTVRLVDTFLTPNVFSYLLLWSACLFFRPIRYSSAFWAIVAFLGQSLYFGSFEAGSVWCWSCVLMFVGAAVQAHMLPLRAPITGRYVCEEELRAVRRHRRHHAIGTEGVTYDRPRSARGMDRCEAMIAAPGWPFSPDAKCTRSIPVKVPPEKDLMKLARKSWLYRSTGHLASFDQSRHRGIPPPPPPPRGFYARHIAASFDRSRHRRVKSTDM